MIRSKSIEDRLREGRLDSKSRDSTFLTRVEEGANCPPFVSKAILPIVGHEKHALSQQDGSMKWETRNGER
jgi:hypothetical protein